mmetsp:Transcript_15737/g.44934  ORF Transcript_15737/g.44934 Transcript_15737/m.44934 type:complete len:353 (+) Transcript_15737:180-1238(+)
MRRSHQGTVGNQTVELLHEHVVLVRVVEVGEDEGREVRHQQEVDDVCQGSQPGLPHDHVRAVQVLVHVEDEHEDEEGQAPPAGLGHVHLLDIGARVRPADHPHRRHERQYLGVVRGRHEHQLVVPRAVPRRAPEEGQEPLLQEDLHDLRAHGCQERRSCEAPDVAVLPEAGAREAEAKDGGEERAGRGQRGPAPRGRPAGAAVLHEEAGGHPDRQEGRLHQQDLGAELEEQAHGVHARQEPLLEEGEREHGEDDHHEEVPDRLVVLAGHVLVRGHADGREQQEGGEDHAVAAVQLPLGLPQHTEAPCLATARGRGVGLELHVGGHGAVVCAGKVRLAGGWAMPESVRVLEIE